MRQRDGVWDVANGVLAFVAIWAGIATWQDHPAATAVLGVTIVSLFAYTRVHR
jgi:hypothetical protein